MRYVRGESSLSPWKLGRPLEDLQKGIQRHVLGILAVSFVSKGEVERGEGLLLDGSVETIEVVGNHRELHAQGPR
jgi:hypothetical protein